MASNWQKKNGIILNIYSSDETHLSVTIIVIINGQSLLSKVNLKINHRISSVMCMPKYQSVPTITALLILMCSATLEGPHREYEQLKEAIGDHINNVNTMLRLLKVSFFLNFYPFALFSCNSVIIFTCAKA
jgi:hypothetical protein